MIAVYIIGGILLVLALIGLIKLSFGIDFCGDVRITVGIGFLKFRRRLGAPKAPAHRKPEAPPKKEKADKPAKPKKDKGKPDIYESIRIGFAALMKIIRKFGKYLTPERFLIRINVSLSEPDTTAVVYGALAGAAAELTAAVMSLPKAGKGKNIKVEVTPDFISGSFDAAADVVLSIRVWQAASIAVTAFIAFLKVLKTRKTPGKELS